MILSNQEIKCSWAHFDELEEGTVFFTGHQPLVEWYVALGDGRAICLTDRIQLCGLESLSLVYIPEDKDDISSITALAYKQGMRGTLIAVAAMFPEISEDKLNDLYEKLTDAYDDDPEISRARYQRILDSLMPIGPGDIVEVTNKNKANDSYKILVTELNHNALYGINLDSTKAYAGLLMRGNTELLHEDDRYMYKRIGHEDSYMNLLKSLSNTYQSNKEEE